jgi:flavin-binding protein dodecin
MKRARTRSAPQSEASGEGRRPVGNPNHVYRVIEIVGTSESSVSDAIDRAIARADKTLRNLRWFEVLRTSGQIAGGKVVHYQVTLEVGFTMEEPA